MMVSWLVSAGPKIAEDLFRLKDVKSEGEKEGFIK